MKNQKIYYIQYIDNFFKPCKDTIETIIPYNFKFTYSSNKNEIIPGSPIFLENNSKVIGIQTSILNMNEKYGNFIEPIINSLKNNYEEKNYRNKKYERVFKNKKKEGNGEYKNDFIDGNEILSNNDYIITNRGNFINDMFDKRNNSEEMEVNNEIINQFDINNRESINDFEEKELFNDDNKSKKNKFNKKYILFGFGVLILLSLFFVLLKFLPKKKKKPEDENENNCLSDYELIDGYCLSYSFKAIYFTNSNNETISLINSNYTPDIFKIKIDNNYINSTSEYTFNSKGDHIIYSISNKIK